MNNAIQMLFEEHSVIVTAIDAAENAESLIGINDILYEKTIRELLYFFRKYADNYHHRKEEEILFPEMKKKNELLADGVLKEMFDNHEEFREMLRNIERLLDEKNYMNAQKQLNIYCNSLLDHIHVENEEVFQMSETLFNDDELGKIYFRFEDCDREIGSIEKKELAEHINEIRNNIIYN